MIFRILFQIGIGKYFVFVIPEDDILAGPSDDVLGKQGKIVRHTDQEFVLAKPLEGGDLAVGVFNLAPTKQKMTVTWQDLGLKGRCRVRDVWRQKDIGDQADQFSTDVNPHGVAFIRLIR